MKRVHRNAIGAALLAVAVAIPGFLHVRGLADADRAFEIAFPAGDALSAGGREAAAQVAALMIRNPRMEALVVGHTGTLGTPEGNLSLSESRAAAVARAIQAAGVERGRIKAVGAGAADPLPRQDGEHSRLYQQRLARVEISVFAPALWTARP